MMIRAVKTVDHLATSINAMHLKHRLGDVETDCCD